MSKKKESNTFDNVIKRQLHRTLPPLDVFMNQFLDYSDESFLPVKETIFAHLKEWLDMDDISQISMQITSHHLRENGAQISSGTVSEYLTEAQLAACIDEIVAVFNSIPLTYEILFPLPNIRIPEDIRLSENISLVRRTSPSRLKGGALTVLDDSNVQAYFKTTARGYSSLTRGKSAMREALSKLKWIVQAGAVRGVFCHRVHGARGISLPNDNQNKLCALVNRLGADTIETSLVELGLGMSRYLEQLEIFTDEVPFWDRKLSSISVQVPIKPEALAVEVPRTLAPLVHLLTQDAFAENTQSLRSALEWAFDAEADDEIVPSLIKKCIALEAILGEHSEDPDARGRITDRFADRCAYLLGSTPSERAAIRRDMKEVYTLRSELVHGAKIHLTHKDHRIKESGDRYLSRVLSTEISMLEKWLASREASSKH
ncbi:hypothetical protein ACO0LO_01885 [Undibacterium sp. TJN25]|uniref:hypothetical protein n=1 Tax=Undibacterium sp. TJN25 TaxID=3413056 RepID=UPI003BF0DAA0